MYNRPVEHLCPNSILVDEQFRFRKNLTTKNATYNLINGILRALSEKLIVGEYSVTKPRLFIVVHMTFYS